MHLLIAYFLCNMSAEYYENLTMITRVIAVNIGGKHWGCILL